MATKVLNLTTEATRALRARAEGIFRSDAIERADGTWDIPFQASTVERIDSERFDGESYSDAIIRICATAGRPRN